MEVKHLKTTLIAAAIVTTSSFVHAESFQRISTFAVADNIPAGKKSSVTSSEIITASEDGNTLIYSDSPLGGVGFIDIKNPKQPLAAGFLDLQGEPTSVAAIGSSVVVGVNTSKTYTEPSGYLATVSIASRKLIQKCDLGGQPDSVAVSKDGRFVAVAIENERDEELNDGELPQMPAGYLSIVPMKDNKLDCASIKRVDLTGITEIAPTDPEPEFVSFNDKNEIAVTLQENNHIAIIDAESGKIINHFSAGSVDLNNIDIKKDGALTFSDSLSNVRREPDAVKWLDYNRLVIANEGDYKGGARGFTIFNKQGKVLFESGTSFEYEVIKAGHYPEKRSGKKGAEPEGVEVAKFGDNTYLFIMSERGSIMAVYRDTGADPELVQMLPSGIAPESAIAIPKRGLIATANEEDLGKDKLARSHVMIYQLSDKAPTYPMIQSTMDNNGRPIGWGALSGLTADLTQAGTLYAISDSFYSAQPAIFTIDASQTPALIKDKMIVTSGGHAAEKLDLEGIAVDPKGGYWLASEGNAEKSVPHQLLHVTNSGAIDQTVPFPEELLQYQERFGAEGIAIHGDTLWVAIQRPWKDDEKNSVKLLSYNTQSKQWGAVKYPLETVKKGWIGLSEITIYGENAYLLERDNQLDSDAKVKRLYKVALSELQPSPLGSALPTVKKTLVHDFLSDLKSTNGYVVDKIEGFTIDASGQGYAVTDNDGVDDSSGETLFFKVNQF
ncbi:esterase-like activity of phytase family protein [Vibrio ziniensis]|uniref:Alkaline phosphatase n=1 Tax=Vibrio ziniensis TaxID=2711221 RepID=A0A6G7CN34_9VIBR|nr:esterase-like activity of phytase family protein [Vibrio ziniensis]QIH43519.1 alkaline phosphatase [Vibrio ziniensis]